MTYEEFKAVENLLHKEVFDVRFPEEISQKNLEEGLQLIFNQYLEVEE